MVKLHSSRMFVKDPIDVWGKEHTIGNAELAARLGSPITFDRRGTVFAYDDFEDSPLKWRSSFGTGGGGTGHSITLSDEHSYCGSGCMKIIEPDVVGDYALAYRKFGGVAQNKIGIEIDLMLKDTLNYKPSISIRAYTGTRLIQAGIRIQQNVSGGLSYLQATDPSLDASWTSFNTDFSLDVYIPYPIKFVIDLDSEKYVRCMFGGTEIDMSSYTPYATDSTYVQHVIADIYAVNSIASNHNTYVDNFIFTIEEPA